MKRSTITNLILVLVLLAGLSLLLYPSFSDYWNSLHQSRAITVYADSVAELDNEQYQEILDAAVAYNESLLLRENQFSLTAEQRDAYPDMLNLLTISRFFEVSVDELISGGKEAETETVLPETETAAEEKKPVFHKPLKAPRS